MESSLFKVRINLLGNAMSSDFHCRSYLFPTTC